MKYQCPKCGKAEPRWTRQCPAYGGQGVCVECCYKCKDYRVDAHLCLWHQHHPPEISKKEQLQRQISNALATANMTKNKNVRDEAISNAIALYKQKLSLKET